MFKSYLKLTKYGIVVFSLLTGMAGFSMSYYAHEGFEFSRVIIFLLGLYLISSGSFALNQAQEWKIDSKMPRTQGRPIPQGKISAWQAFGIGGLFVLSGSFFLFILSPISCYLGLATVFMYNVLYTLYWKRKWSFAAVPGAIPGAMPVVIGYAINDSNILTTECMYLFAIMFLWQMPHFWCLAIRFKDDYEKGGIPTLPVAVGVPRTLYHMGLYTFVYVGLAIASPWFIKASWAYLIFVVPFALVVLWQFLVFYKNSGRIGWLKFFMVTNFSMLVFVIAPVIDKWL